MLTNLDAFSASLLDQQLRFGKYPTNEEVIELIKHDYAIFVDLCPCEEITWQSYPTDNINRIHYPIKDRTANIKCDLNDNTIGVLIKTITDHLNNNKRVYIHCLGGHGRSGVISAIIFGLMTKCSPEMALAEIHTAHQKRTEIKPKLRRLGSPQTAAQKRAVVNYLNK